MEGVKVKINTTEYTLLFGISCLRKLGQLWGYNSLNEVLERIAVLDQFSSADVNFMFAPLDVLEDVIKASIMINPKNTINEDDFICFADWIINNMDKVSKIIIGIANSMPQQVEGKPKAPEGAKRNNKG